MAPSRTSSTSHEWTNFELHTLLCLMAKGIHISGRGKKTDDPNKMKQHTYLDVATALNDAVHKGDFANDIHKKEVAKMIDQLLAERKGVVGKGGYMERQFGGRITRGLKRVWERKPPVDFDGSVSEWKMWRKQGEAEKERERKGLPPLKNIEIDENSPVVQASKPNEEDVWGAAASAASKIRSSNRSRWVGDSRQNTTSEIQAQSLNKGRVPGVKGMGGSGHDAFENLPAHLKYSDKFSWRASEKMQSSTIIQTTDKYCSTQQPTLLDSYRPSIDGPLSKDSLPSSNQVPDLTHDYDSSPNKSATSDADTPVAVSSVTPFDLNNQIDDLLATELASQNKSLSITGADIPSPFKKILMDQAINPERAAMLVCEDGEVKMDMQIYGDESSIGKGRKISGANKDPLPFNRLDRESGERDLRAASQMDVDMVDGEEGTYGEEN